jgi:hypothetical protein
MHTKKTPATFKETGLPAPKQREYTMKLCISPENEPSEKLHPPCIAIR